MKGPMGARSRIVLAAVLGASALAGAPGLTASATGRSTEERHATAPTQDLDAFMARVLARRDDNWKKMQQYVLDEEERLQVTGPDGSRLYGFVREYTWYIRDGVFVRSPLTANGVRIDEDERLAYEERWMRRERRRQARARAERARDEDASESSQPAEVPEPAQEGISSRGDVLSSAIEPRFVSAAYFLRFKFDPGHYALAGRTTWNGREVLQIEYYPSKLFTEGRTKPDRRVRERDEQIDEKMNKVSLVTLWIDPAQHQILQYTFDNMDMDFLPGRSIVRVDELRASMTMTEAFPDVWLPGTIQMRFGFWTAAGAVSALYDVRYHDYRLARVTSSVKPPPPRR